MANQKEQQLTSDTKFNLSITNKARTLLLYPPIYII